MVSANQAVRKAVILAGGFGTRLMEETDVRPKPMVEIGGITVRDVDALVLPDEALSENLLGLSFLSKLKRFEYANGKLLLEQ